jgi:hypothetical protein
MILTEKEIKTLEVLNEKKEIYEYVEVEALGLGGVTKTVNKLVKIGAKAKRVNPVMEMVAKDTKEYTMAEITDMDEARRLRAKKNNL